jgi:predicted MPP superfamily phosphohydrolase
MTQATSVMSMTRRLLRWLAGFALSGAATVSYARLVEPHWLDVTQVELQIAGLPERLAGRRIAQLSDIHLCEFTDPTQLEMTVTQVNELQPDWLFLTGDYVGDDARHAAGLIEPLRRVQAPIYAVYGNHDYWSDVQIVRAMLEQAGVQVLRNQARPLLEGLWLAGVDDIWGGRPDLAATLRDVPAKATTLLLAHEPDYFDLVIQQAAPVAVQLSGHTHGGQVRLPLPWAGPDGRYSYAPLLPRYGRRYPIGLRRVGQRQVYTNRGLGLWPLPYRLNCRPELTLFTLAPGR